MVHWARRRSRTEPGNTICGHLQLRSGVISVAEETLFQRVDSALDQIRPAIRMDGGDVELVDVEGGIAKVRMVGACGGCPMSTMTLKMGIERAIRQQVPEVKAVEAV